MTSRLLWSLLLLIVLLLPQTGLAVSQLVVNGLQGGTLTDPRTLDLLVDFDSADPGVYLVIAADLNQDGSLDAGEPCIMRLFLADNQWADLSPTVGQVIRQFALPAGITGPIVIAAYQQSAEPVQHGYVALPPPGWLTIAGRVVDAAGDPAPGSLIEVNRQVPCLGVVLPNGTYEVAVPGPGYYELRPLACGGYDYFLPYRRRVEVTTNVTDINFRALIDQEWWSVPVEVVLQDNGEPVPGCRVAIADEGEEYRWMAFTDINGACVLRVPPWSYYNLWPEAVPSGVAGNPYYAISEAPFAPIRMELARGDLLVAGTFTVDTATISTMISFDGPGSVYTCSDLTGRYECLLAPGTYDFQAGFLPPLAPEPPSLDISGILALSKPAVAQSWVTYDVTASAWYPLSGTVVRSDDGQPVPWAAVVAFPDNATGEAWTITDGSGAYSLLLPLDSYSVGAWSPDLRAENWLYPVSPPATSVNIEIPVDNNSLPNVAVEVVTSAGLPTDTFIVNGYFQDDDGDFPEQMILYVNDLPYQMEMANPEDWDSTDGLEFTCELTGLALGAYECRVGAWEQDHGAYVESPESASFEVTACVLDSLEVPSLTDVVTPVTCRVHYRGTEEPLSVVACYRLPGAPEGWGVLLSLTSGTPLDGIYSGELSLTVPGDYEVIFAATSDEETWYYAPSEGYLPLAVMPRLSGMALTPSSGSAGEYAASLDYQNSLGHWPDSVKVVCRKVGTLTELEDVLSTSDTDPTDGASYTGSIWLPAGNWEHQFRCNYRGVTVNSDWITGPQVTADVPQISLDSPAEGSTVSGVVPIYPAISDADGVATVAIRVDGTAIYTWSRSPAPAKVSWGCGWDTRPLSVAEGAHTITIEVTDVEGLSSTLTRHLTVDNCTFDDVPKTASYWAYVEAVVREGITSGCSTTPRLFCPNSSVTRGQMAVFLCRAMGLAPYDNPTPTFADVPRGSAQYTYIEAIYRAGITGGCATAPLRYCPTSAVTRGQMAVFLCRAADIAPYVNPVPTFGDVPAGSSQYAYIEGLYAAGVTGGCSSSPPMFCPSRTVTRAQMAVFLCRAFEVPLE